MRKLLAFLLLLTCATACTGSGNSKQNCDKRCSGTIDGAAYAIRVPKDWNGTLLLFSHGYRAAGAPNFPSMSIADSSGQGTDRVSQMLLAKGFAIAGSSYAAQGWATADALKADNDLYKRFVSLKGKPKRTYAWGASLGGLVTELLDERADWVDGAAAFCGAVGGPLPNFDNWLRAAFAVKALLVPQLRVTDFANPADATAQGRIAARAVALAASDRSSGSAAKALYAADLTGVPDKTVQFAKDNPATAGNGAMQALQEYLRLWFLLVPDLEKRFGGLPASVPTTTAQLTPAQSNLITQLHGDATSLGAELTSSGGLSADQKARTAAEQSGTPTGKLRVPLLTLHGAYDPFALVANETILRDHVAAAGKSALLQQSYVVPSGSYGYGHCAFTAQQVVGTLTALDGWVRTGNKPTQRAVAAAAVQDVDPNYQPPAWPN